tara:strand:+ start:801 stop:965 length:165 start_codon:yes stop_codon:yes gene_type:complete
MYGNIRLYNMCYISDGYNNSNKRIWRMIELIIGIAAMIGFAGGLWITLKIGGIL